jgi:hypothetical protein
VAYIFQLIRASRLQTRGAYAINNTEYPRRIKPNHVNKKFTELWHSRATQAELCLPFAMSLISSTRKRAAVEEPSLKVEKAEVC